MYLNGAIESTTEDNTEHLDQHRSPPGRLVRQLGRPRIWFATTAIFLVFASAFFMSSAPFAIPAVEAACGQQPPDMRFFTSADDVTSFLDACGPTGRETYRNMQLADLAYPAVVGLFLASSLALVIGHLAPRGSNAVRLALLPLVASSFDYAENVFAWLALGRYPDSAVTDAVLGYASAAKNVSFWASGTLLLGALAILGAQRVWRTVRPVHGEPGESRSAGRRALSA